MSLGKRLVQSAQKEAALKRPLPLQASAEETLTSGATITARATFADTDKYTKMTGEITVSSDAPSNGRTSGVQERAERFASSATYLSEALTYVETDAGGTATVRSTPETMTGRRSPYFEARVSQSQVSLRRFQPNETGPGRSEVPFPLADDSLARVVEDAANTLRPRRDRS